MRGASPIPSGGSAGRPAGQALILLAGALGVAAAGWLGEWPGPRAGTTEPPMPAGQGAENGVPRARKGLVLTDETKGKVLFGRYCDSCHTGGREVLAPSLRSRQFKRVYAPEGKIEQTVRTGGFDMPPYPRELLADRDLQDIVAYIQSLSEE